MISVLAFSLSLSQISVQAIDHYSVINKQFTELGIEKNTRKHLLEKIQNGELLDSMKKEYAQKAPDYIVRNDGVYEEHFSYPDGSVKVLRINTGVFTGHITGGSQSSGSYWYVWNNAKVSATWGVVTASFRADFEGANGAGIIHRVYDYSIQTAGGTFSQAKLTKDRANASQSDPARATLFFIATAVNGYAQTTVYLRLYVPYSSGPYAKMII